MVSLPQARSDGLAAQRRPAASAARRGRRPDRRADRYRCCLARRRLRPCSPASGGARRRFARQAPDRRLHRRRAWRRPAARRDRRAARRRRRAWTMRMYCGAVRRVPRASAPRRPGAADGGHCFRRSSPAVRRRPRSRPPASPRPTAPTPSGVPMKIRSPGASSTSPERYAMVSATDQMWCASVLDWRTWPLTASRTGWLGGRSA